MPSPFPGMDPYLERHWLDVHTSLVSSARTRLNQVLPADLIARAEERIAVEAEADDADGSGGRRRHLGPDVRVFEGVADVTASATSGGVALAPYRLVLLDEPITERFIEIIDVRGGERLVTVIEFVSPTNKVGRGLEAFVRKRDDLLAGGVNFVAIDLVRQGDWEAMLSPHRCPHRALSAYRGVIYVPSDPLAAYLQPIALREPLPVLRIPLRPNDVACELPLQKLMEEAYVSGRYDRTLDYRRPSEPPLAGEDAAWADELLRTAGRR